MKSYKLSPSLKAELVRRKKSGFDFSLVREIKISWRPIILSVVFLAFAFGAYFGVKKSFDHVAMRRQVAKQQALAQEQERIDTVKDGVKSMAKDAYGYAELSQKMLNDNEVDKSVIAAEYAVAMDPNWRDGYLNLAQIYLSVKRPADAQIILEKSLKIDPNYGLTHYLLSESYKDQKNNDMSCKELAKAKALGLDTEFGGN